MDHEDSVAALHHYYPQPTASPATASRLARIASHCLTTCRLLSTPFKGCCIRQGLAANQRWDESRPFCLHHPHHFYSLPPSLQVRIVDLFIPFSCTGGWASLYRLPSSAPWLWPDTSIYVCQPELCLPSSMLALIRKLAENTSGTYLISCSFLGHVFNLWLGKKAACAFVLTLLSFTLGMQLILGLHLGFLVVFHPSAEL